jgi:hypothetical protein
LRFAKLVLIAFIAIVSFSGCGGGGNAVIEAPEDYQPTAQEVAEVERMMDEREQEARAQGRR